MKKLFLILSVLLVPVVSAEFQFEVVRSVETPGYFLLKIIPDQKLTPTQTTTFVQNYPDSQATTYEKIFPRIFATNGEIIDRSELVFSSLDKEKNIVVLGEPIGDFPNFQASPAGNIVTEFQNFCDNQPALIATDIEIETGGNVFGVLIENTELRRGEPWFAIGKFRGNHDTRLVITLNTADGPVKLEAVIPTSELALSENKLAPYLEDMWNETALRLGKKSAENFSDWSLFPYLLGSVGVFFILLALFIAHRSHERRERRDQLKINFDHRPPTTIQKSAAPENPPFEVM